jgi:hypothetical protein
MQAGGWRQTKQEEEEEEEEGVEPAAEARRALSRP